MTIEVGPNGLVVSAETLAPLLGVPPEAVPRLMREGAITGRFEVGADEDEGRYRMTLWHEDHQLRLTVDAHGQVLSTTRVRTQP